MARENLDEGELGKFEDMAHRWWDPEGELKPLHEINPLRLDYIQRHARLRDRRVVDVGCGGGLLTEAMAARGAQVTGIDQAEQTLSVAHMHQLESGLEIDYRLSSAEALAESMPGAFDVVTCMELLEHVPDPASVVDACSRLLRPGGTAFFSTINRNPKAFLLAIVGAEYVLGLLPRGTHRYDRLIRPSELDRWARAAGLTIQDLAGIQYNPLNRRYRLADDIDVNYMAYATAD